MPSWSRFPVYVLPPIPFRRHKVGRNSPSSETTIQYFEGGDFNSRPNYLHGHTSHLQCARCTTDLCSTSQIISKGFTGRHGRAYLVSPNSPLGNFTHSSKAGKFSSLPNTHVHKTVSRQLVTGAHTVSDVSCAFCGSVLGWKYDGAEEESQRYKVGKFILETKKIYSSSCWESDGWGEAGPRSAVERHPRDRENELHDWEHDPNMEFDSQDEDECEDLFAGLWSPVLANKRRQARKFDGAGISYDAKIG